MHKQNRNFRYCNIGALIHRDKRNGLRFNALAFLTKRLTTGATGKGRNNYIAFEQLRNSHLWGGGGGGTSKELSIRVFQILFRDRFYFRRKIVKATNWPPT